MDQSIMHGFFMIPSGIILVEGRHHEMDRMFRPPGPSTYSFASVDYEIKRGMTIPLSVRDTLLTYLHEVSHYRQLMSTPLGLMLWRALNVICVDANFLARHVTWLRPSVEAEFPLDRWLLQEGGMAKYEQARSRGATIDPLAQPVSWYAKEGFVEYMRYLLREVAVTDAFLDAVTGHSEVTVGEFVELANMAFWIMNRRSDLKVEVRWSTRLPADTPLLGDTRYSGNEIIEAAARLEEHGMLNFLNVPAEDFEDWRRTRIFSVYRPAYEHLMAELGDVDAAKSVIDVALMTPIDPAFAGATGGELLVEDIHPSFRLQRLIEAARDSFWPQDPSRRNRFLAEGLARAAGLPTPAQVAKVGAEAVYSGERSWDASAQLHDPSTTLGVPYDLAQEDVRRAIRKRVERPAFVLEERSGPDAVRPLIQFFQDGASIGSPVFGQGGNQIIEKSIRCYRKFIVDGICLALLGRFEVATLLACESKILERFLPEFGEEGDPLFEIGKHSTEEQLREIVGVREIAAKFIAEDRLSLLGL